MTIMNEKLAGLVRKEKTRQEIVDDAKRIRADIAQIFEDAEAYNKIIREPHEAIIDPDPDGQMASLAQSIDRMLENEERVKHETGVML